MGHSKWSPEFCPGTNSVLTYSIWEIWRKLNSDFMIITWFIKSDTLSHWPAFVPPNSSEPPTVQSSHDDIDIIVSRAQHWAVWIHHTLWGKPAKKHNRQLWIWEYRTRQRGIKLWPVCMYVYIYIYTYIYTDTLTQIINATLFLPPFFMSWTQRSKTFLCTQKAYFSQIWFTNLSKSVLVSTSL